MNKRVKIVATLGPAVEIRGGKKFGEDGYWGEKLDVEIEVPDKAFTTVSDIGERKQFAKEFTLYVGTHQPDELSCQLSGTNCMSIEIER